MFGVSSCDGDSFYLLFKECEWAGSTLDLAPAFAKRLKSPSILPQDRLGSGAGRVRLRYAKPPDGNMGPQRTYDVRCANSYASTKIARVG